MKFEIICTGWNCKDYVGKCVHSVINQTIQNFHLHLIDDGSTDGTADIIRKYSGHPKISIHIHTENKGAALRRMQVIRSLDDDSVCLLLGMDDELLPGCLERVKKEYKAGKLMTYGNWKDQHGHVLPESFDLDFDEKTHQNRDYRKVLYRSTAPNTFKKFLFNQITDEDFKLNGKWIDSTTESELMFSCLEQCGKERIGIIREPIYLYNRNRKGGTLERKYEVDGKLISGKDYKYLIYDEIVKRPKKPLYEKRNIVSVGLPCLNAPIAWLAMEGLVAQKCTVPWELIVYEDADSPNGEDFFYNYLDRLENCEQIIYIYSEQRISLSLKWRQMADYMALNSLGLLLQAADCYSEPQRIQLTYEKLKHGFDWVHSKQGYFLNINTGQTMWFSMKSGTLTGLNMAISKAALKLLPKEDLYSGVDHWLFTRAQQLKKDFTHTFYESPDWKKGVDTDGENRVSIARRKMYASPTQPFFRLRLKASDILPREIVERLKVPGISYPAVIKKAPVNLHRSATVLNISSNDWANYSYYNSASLRAAGVDCIGLKLHPHSFGYADQHEVVMPNELQAIIQNGKFEIIQVFNSDWTMLNYLRGYKGKIVVYHTGTGYRNKAAEINSYFNPFVWKSIIALSEFENSGAKNWEYLSVAVDTYKMKPIDYPLSKPYRFLHVPSHANVKGSEQIKRMIASIGNINFKADLRRLDHEESWERMRHCDIYIELFKPVLDGRQYGSFGTTAAEAAALGKVVVTQNLGPHIYENAYGDCPLILAKDEQDFIQKIKWLNDLPEKKLRALQNAHRKWAVNKHSFKATGEKLKKILEIE